MQFWLIQVCKTVPEPYLDEVFHIPQAQAYWTHPGEARSDVVTEERRLEVGRDRSQLLVIVADGVAAAFEVRVVRREDGDLGQDFQCVDGRFVRNRQRRDTMLRRMYSPGISGSLYSPSSSGLSPGVARASIRLARRIQSMPCSAKTTVNFRVALEDATEDHGVEETALRHGRVSR